MTALTDRYARLTASADHDTRRVATAQLARLERRRPPTTANRDDGPACWRHVPIADLLSEAGNAVTERANGTIVGGHEPCHGSRSGACLVLWPDEGRWWCSSCHQGGDAVALLMSLRGWSYRRATRYLAEHHGLPDSPNKYQRRRRVARVLRVEVAP